MQKLSIWFVMWRKLVGSLPFHGSNSMRPFHYVIVSLTFRFIGNPHTRASKQGPFLAGWPIASITILQLALHAATRTCLRKFFWTTKWTTKWILMSGIREKPHPNTYSLSEEVVASPTSPLWMKHHDTKWFLRSEKKLFLFFRKLGSHFTSTSRFWRNRSVT